MPGPINAAAAAATAAPLPPPPPLKKVKTEYGHLIASQESLFNPDAVDNNCPGLAAVLQESPNDVLPLDMKTCCAWSL